MQACRDVCGKELAALTSPELIRHRLHFNQSIVTILSRPSHTTRLLETPLGFADSGTGIDQMPGLAGASGHH